MLKEPKITIVLTSYNQRVKLEKAFESLISQTYRNIDIIIVDDCSTDGVSQNYIKSLSETHHNVCFFIQEKNVGIAKNKNTGFKMAKGDLITYLDGDDYFLPTKIEEELKVMLSDETIDVVYSNFRIENDFGETLSLWSEGKDKLPEGNIFKQAITRDFPKGILFRFELMKREVLNKINFYDEGILAFHDWDSRIRYSKFCNVKFSSNVGAAYVQDPAGISKVKTGFYLLEEMKSVYHKNRPLLDDLPLKEKNEIQNKVYDLFLKKEIYQQENFQSFVRYSTQFLKRNPGGYRFIVSQMIRKIRGNAINFFNKQDYVV